MQKSDKPKALCVGGPLDGIFVEMTGQHTHLRAPFVKQSATVANVNPTNLDPGSFVSCVEYEEYRFEVFYTPMEGKKFYFAIPIGQSIEQTMQMLVDSYKEKKS